MACRRHLYPMFFPSYYIVEPPLPIPVTFLQSSTYNTSSMGRRSTARARNHLESREEVGPLSWDFYAAIHLQQVDENFDKVLAYLKGLGVQHLLTGHCTCDDACEIMARQMHKEVNVQVLGAGKVFDI